MSRITTTICTSLMLFFWASLASGQHRELRFSRIADSPVAVDGGLSRGVAWGDVDGDGAPDLVVANTISQLAHLYLNQRNGMFQQVHEQEITLASGWSEGVHLIDFNNDNRLDLFVARTSRSTLFRNKGEMNFEALAIPGATDLDLAASEACWADYDNDGLIDFYMALRGGVPGRLFHNVGGKSFEQVWTGDFAAIAGDARTCAWGDADGDGDPDLFVGNFVTKDESARNFLFRNNGGVFTKWEVNGITTTPNLTYGASWIDFDMDGDLDLFISNVGLRDRNELYENLAAGEFRLRDDLALVANSRGPSKGHLWADFDNDGDLDLYVANGTEGTEDIDDFGVENFLYKQEGGRFVRTTAGALTGDTNISVGAAAADYDGDGDADIYVANWANSDEDNALYRNESESGNWLRLCLMGSASNSDGIGARVILTLAGTGQQISQFQLPDTGYGSTNEPVLHFGLGRAAGANNIQILWPSGQVDEITEQLAGGQAVSIKEGVGVIARRRNGFCAPRRDDAADPS